MSNSTWSNVLQYQLHHIIGSFITSSIAFYFMDKNFPDCSIFLLFIGLAASSLWRFYVMICWRTELYSRSLTNIFGSTTIAFMVYRIGFFVFGISTFISVIIIAFSSPNTIYIPEYLRYALLIFCTVSGFCVVHSVVMYFGLSRATGFDHFYVKKAQKMPLVKEGIYKYVSNAQYKLGVLHFFVPGLYFQSKNSLLAALSHYVCVWMHYYCTEKPDMEYIYS
eukprot:412313_1